MQEFNNCLRKAEIGSDEIGLAYANRSACFFKMGMLQECLMDIEMAKKFNYPSHLMHALNARVSKCKRLLDEGQINANLCKVREPVLSFNEHEEYPGVADCLEIRQNDKFGRHIITTCDLQIGQTILVEEPFSIARDSRVDCDRCLGCFKYAQNFIACNNCVGRCLHCNEDCMTNSFHHIVCNSLIAEEYEEKIELIVKTIFSAIVAFSDIDRLMHTVELLLDGKGTSDLTNAHLILHFVHVVVNQVSLNEYVKLETGSRMDFGFFLPYAHGMYPFGCYMNHSCLPNVCSMSVDNRLICKVIRPIKKGQQIFRSYLNPSNLNYINPLTDRKLDVEKQLHMKCECNLCSGDAWTMLHDKSLKQSPFWKDATAAANMTEKAFRALSNETKEYYENRTIKFLEMYDRFHPLNDTLCVQWALIVMWNVLATHF
ncbi:uncharacterized protein LOC129575905 [Sitodiplosis mosellana]|uniref:uncharacterized protein LOC129575905 n=1 Tax=Sitodiplosis mosellana TaxID=263140 RepID=UPI0024442717|nr:uncharacterized protein LOC129575905 [Sitodiplosis mosellana]